MTKLYRVKLPAFGLTPGIRFRFDSEAADDRNREMHAAMLRQNMIEWVRDDRGPPEIRGERQDQPSLA